MGSKKAAHFEAEIQRLQHENIELVDTIRNRESELRGANGEIEV